MNKLYILIVSIVFSTLALADFNYDYNAQLACSADPKNCSESLAPNTIDNLTPGYSHYKVGDTVILPNAPGSFVILVSNQHALYWNANLGMFSEKPFRNIVHAAISVPFNTPPGNYYLYEVTVKQKYEFVATNNKSQPWLLTDTADPSKFENWEFVRVFPVTIH